jgi:hypothetical protein
MAFLDRRVHKQVADFLSYLAQTMPVLSTTCLVKTTEPQLELTSLDTVTENEILVLKQRNEQWVPPASMLGQKKKPESAIKQPPPQQPPFQTEMEINPKFKALSN